MDSIDDINEAQQAEVLEQALEFLISEHVIVGAWYILNAEYEYSEDFWVNENQSVKHSFKLIDDRYFLVEYSNGNISFVGFEVGDE